MNPNPELISIRLKCACPRTCICKSDDEREWVHQKCRQPNFITAKGDIFCKQKGCQPYFIRDARFQCEEAQKHNTYYQHQSAAKFLMSIAQAIQAADFSLNDNDLVIFVSTINKEVVERWNN